VSNKSPKLRKKHVFDNPRNIKRVVRALYAACLLAFLADFIVHRHVDHPWESLFGFFGVYGFVACVILVLVAKQLRKILMRGEDYYDDK